MLESFLKYFQQLSADVLPELVTILLVCGPAFLLILYISYKTRNLVRKLRILWYVQILVFILIAFGLKPIFLSLNIINSALLEKASLSLIILVITHVLDQAIDLFFWEGFFLKKYEKSAPSIVVGILAIVLYLAAAYLILTFVFKQPMTGFIVSSSIMAGVIGLAMQSSLSDLVAGIAISVERPFKIGEWVELDDGTLGEVTEINWRATHILSWHNSLYILPNARISNARVHNFNRPVPAYGQWFFVHVPCTVEPSLVRRVLLEGCIESTRVLDDPAPVIRIAEAGASYKYMIFVHFENYQTHYGGIDDLLMKVWIKCYQHGIVPSAVTTEMIFRRGIAEEISEPSPQSLLKHVEIFKDLNEQYLRLILSQLKVLTMKPGQKIVGHG